MLIGKTGHGKSSTGNSILMKDDYFDSCGDGDSQTQHYRFGITRRSTDIFRVIDTPGLCDTRYLTQSEANKKVYQVLQQSLSLCADGIDCFLYVFRFGSKFTKEETSVLETLTDMFGTKMFEYYGIVLFTDKRAFLVQQKKNPQTLQEWRESQTGALGKLLDMCKGRFIFFDNLEPNIEQRHSLFSMVNDLHRQNVIGDEPAVYSCQLFRQAVDEAKKRIEDRNMPAISKEVVDRLDLLKQDLDRALRERDDFQMLLELDDVKEDAILLLDAINSLEYTQGKLNNLSATIAHFVENVGSRAEAKETLLELNKSFTDIMKEAFGKVATAAVTRNIPGILEATGMTIYSTYKGAKTAWKKMKRGQFKQIREQQNRKKTKALTQYKSTTPDYLSDNN